MLDTYTLVAQGRDDCPLRWSTQGSLIQARFFRDYHFAFFTVTFKNQLFNLLDLAMGGSLFVL